MTTSELRTQVDAALEAVTKLKAKAATATGDALDTLSASLATAQTKAAILAERLTHAQAREAAKQAELDRQRAEREAAEHEASLVKATAELDARCIAWADAFVAKATELDALVTGWPALIAERDALFANEPPQRRRPAPEHKELAELIRDGQRGGAIVSAAYVTARWRRG